jgi:hypothetical protein
LLCTHNIFDNYQQCQYVDGDIYGNDFTELNISFDKLINWMYITGVYICRLPERKETNKKLTNLYLIIGVKKMSQEPIATIKINEIEYVRKDSIQNYQPAEKFEDMPFVLIRTCSAGVHFGYLVKRQSTLAGIEVTLKDAKRIWSWEGACSLSQIATDGLKNPNSSNNKISVPVLSIDLIAIEIISVTEKARKNLSGVKEWKQ